MDFLKKSDAYSVPELADHIIALESIVERLLQQLITAEKGIGDAHGRIQDLEDKVSRLEGEIEDLEQASE